MKRTILMVVLLMVAALGFSQSWIGMEYSLEMSWLPSGAVAGYESIGNVFTVDDEWLQWVLPSSDQWWNTFRIVLDSNVILWKHVFIGGAVATMMSADTTINLGNFIPFWTDFTFRTGVRWGPLEIGYTHLCSHPILPNAYAQFITKLWGEASYDRVYLKISGSF